MSMKYLLAHDIGTSGNKVSLFSVEGKLIKSVTVHYDVKWFDDVCAEQNADDWYGAVCQSTKDILEDIDNKDVIGVSFSGQMMGCLCVDKDGNPLANSIIWADMRATDQEAFIKEKIDENVFYKLTGHKPSASYTLAKLLWIKDNTDIYDKTYKVLNAKDYIILKLTGEFVTDYSDASGTNFLDLEKLEWSTKIADAVGVDIEKMPTLKKSTDIVGHVTEKAAYDTGLLVGTPIICGGGDGSVAAVGSMCTSVGTAYLTVGTSAWNSITSEKPVLDDNKSVFNFAHVVDGLYSPCGTMQTAGASIGWMADEIAHIETKKAQENGGSKYDYIEEQVEKSQVGSNGVIFLPYLLGERSPRWNVHAKGCFIGLKMETKRGDILRSVYEGVAMNLGVILDVLRAENDISDITMTGGGAKSKIWCQIFADVYNLPVKIPNYLEEATSIGAAVTAGVGLGVYDSFDVIKDFMAIEKTIYPIEENVEKYKKLKTIFNKSYHSLCGVYDDLSEFTHGK